MQEQQMSESSSSVLPSIQLERSGGESSAPEPTSQSTSDPALSLRAVALSTLKSKRRKAASSTQPFSNLPRPVTIDNSVQLDYGQDDDHDYSEVRSANKSDPPEDLQAREEGEISDSEETSAVQKPVELPPPVTIDAQPSISGDAQSPRDRLPPLSASTTIFKTESPPPSNLLDRISDPQISASIPEHPQQRGLSESSHAADDMDVDTSAFVDENNVRPGLKMNQHQYDTAKDIILDLLGWGVPPGYLIDCGLSREIVFYVFSELNLRLPDGFDTHGLIPYNTSTVRMLTRDSSSRSDLGFRSTSDVDSFSKSVMSPDAHKLHDMEKQRRQELLARKAVYASRKGKAPMTDSASNGLHKGDVELAVPTETVDDFLKTIESGDEPRRNHISQLGHEDNDNMEVDYTTPGDQSTHQDYVHTPTEPPTSADSISFGHISGRSSSSGDVSVSSNGQKRGTKRPVAADFVDFDNEPRLRNGHSHTTLKRKTGGSFASISTTRRCVIDLSDDEEGGAGARPQGNGPGYESPVPVASVSEVNGGYSTPPVGPSSTSTPRLSPGALAEKERQIEEMRQMIAQREKSRVVKSLKFKKMAPNGTLTPEISVSVEQGEDESLLAKETPESSLTMHRTTDHMNTERTAIETIGAFANEQDDDDSSVASTPPPMDESNDTSSTPSQASFEAPVAQTGSGQADIVQDPQAGEKTTEMVDVEPKLSSSAQVRLMNENDNVSTPPKARRKSGPVTRKV
ncbi:hypothetical protein E1B28_012343 [Marasmius oreades]|uniref:Uncharacterized protein n=1 Tax=Marasmius oreades TaxID=181124 RepID=A0A9P7UN53_9AGAR|nr:uncharacterized protein E1B28_012343 [Marasmius oreades]KAG7088337.1 hypothetical protein E1B28_012343 [Marasmius oreades]